MTDQFADQWLQQYGEYVEEAPTIDFNGKLFVFTGLLDSSKDNPIVKKVIKKGGQYRTSVSGLTDYLVVNPSGAGCTKIDDAIEQQMKGKKIKVILLEDLKRALKGKPASQKASASSKPTSVKSTEPSTSVLSDFIIENGILTKYRGYKKDVVIPDSVTSIGDEAFENCYSLTSINVASDNEYYSDKDGVLFNKDKTELIRYPKDKSEDTYTIPDSVEKICARAFYQCKKLKSVASNKSLKEIEKEAFLESGITDVNLSSDVSVLKISDKAFAKCSKLKSAVIRWKKPMGSCINASNDIFSFCGNMERIELSEECRDVMDFKYMSPRIISYGVEINEVPTNYKKNYLAGFVEAYDKYPEEIFKEYISYFKRAYKKFEPDLLDNVTLLRIFVDNKLIKRERIDALIEEANKKNKTEVTAILTEYLKKEFGVGMDSYLDRQEAVIKEEERQLKAAERKAKKEAELAELRKDPNAPAEIVWDIQYYSNYCRLMRYHGGAEEVIVPEEVKGLKVVEVNHVKGGNIKRIFVPDTVEKIGSHAFEWCINLETIHLGKNVKKIGQEAFRGCKKLKEVVFPPKFNYVEKWLLRDCDSLEKIVFECPGHINYGYDSNFLRGARRPKIYVKKSADLDSRFDYLKDYVVVMEE